MNWPYALGTALGNTYTHLGWADAVGWADLLCVSVQLGTQFSEWFLCESLWAFALSVCALYLDTYSLTAWLVQTSGLKTQLITSSAKPSLTAPSPSIPAHFLLRLCSQAPPPTARLALHRALHPDAACMHLSRGQGLSFTVPGALLSTWCKVGTPEFFVE